MIGFCSSPRFVEHDTGPHHPERPDRIRAVLTAVRQAGLIESPNPFPEVKIDFGSPPTHGLRLREIEPVAAEEKWLRTVHPLHHINFVRGMCRAAGLLDQGDTPVSPASFDVALLALGAALRCCDAVMQGQVRRAFAAIRPPGHHAEPDRSMGFCLFSNVAIAARYLQQAYGLKRIAIVDIDVHHGNGTQMAFDNDPSVYFASLHENPRICYPGTGYDWEIGVGPGRGYTLNIPLEPGTGDADYLKMIDTRVVPELDEFRPEFVLISAGFDAHREDPLAQLELTDEGYELVTRSLAALADRHCHGRLVSVLEGGYSLPALGRSVVRHLIGLK